LRQKREAGELHGKIPNAIFTMFETGARSCRSRRPTAGRTVRILLCCQPLMTVRSGNSSPLVRAASNSRACSAGIGFPKYQPCPISQPSRTTVL
jgi:hypothetical protein